MNPFGLFQGFGQMRRSDFEPQGQRPPAQAPRGRSTAPINLAGPVNTGPRGRSGSRPAPQPMGPAMPSRLLGGGGSNDPYGVTPRRGLPADYAYQERLASQQASNSRIAGAARAAAPALAPMRSAAAVVPAYGRPEPMASLDQDYRVPTGQAPMPSQAPLLPQGSTASRANVVLAPIGSSRNEALVQAAGNAGLRLIDPAAAAMFQGAGVLPGMGEGATRRMLSEFGSSNPAMVATPAIDASGVNAAASLSPETLQAAAAGFQQVPTGDRFAYLRPDIAEWARHHQNAPKGLDGKNIVDRFMEQQSRPMPLSGPSTLGFADGRQVTGPLPEGPVRTFADLDRSPGMQNQTMDLFGTGALSTTGAGIGLSAEQQSQLISTPAPAAQTQSVQTAFDPTTNLVDQVQMLREMYRNNSRPNPGTAGPRP